jgi:hypothetical protein
MKNQATTETESQQTPVTEQRETGMPQSVWPEFKRMFLLLFGELSSTERFKDRGDYCFFSVRHQSGTELVVHASDWNGCDVSAPTMGDLLAKIRDCNPEAEKQKKIAALKAELATLEGGAL